MVVGVGGNGLIQSILGAPDHLAAIPANTMLLAIGAMRYLYVAAGRIFPVLRRPPRSCAFADRRRKAIAVAQSLALLAALAPATPANWAATVCALALGLLVYSFGADIIMLLSTEPDE